MSYQDETAALLDRLGVKLPAPGADPLIVSSPLDGREIARVACTTAYEASAAIADAHAAFLAWREVPAPQRGAFVRVLGEELRDAKADLARLVTIEAGKVPSEGLGEVQEMIDICDFAVGLSRQLYGLTMPSERAGHRLMETWHPLGVVGVISAFNFPVAVWSWNAALALVCGNSLIWKPSEKTPLTALACQAIFDRAAKRVGDVPDNLSATLIGRSDLGEAIVDAPAVRLVSATGSTRMGRAVAPRLAGRFARAILELGGNNAAIVCPSADLELATRAIAFSAMGTAGQRCTSLRRLFVHRSLHDALIARLKPVYQAVRIGNPLNEDVLVGPLIDAAAFEAMQAALAAAKADGGRCTGGERVQTGAPGAFYVRPALVEMPTQTGIMREETFAPILYVMPYDTLDEAIALQNDVAAGLSSSIFTRDVQEAERFLSASGSDCGIANVNIGTSGAEIGGAFGGEKETGGGRESGSDAWKAYMRRATNTFNYSSDLPLAQGVSFDI